MSQVVIRSLMRLRAIATIVLQLITWYVTQYGVIRKLAGHEPLRSTVNPRLWPESEEYCDVPWGELRTRLG